MPRDFVRLAHNYDYNILQEDTRLKYSYFHPGGIEQPVLYAFKKPENAKQYVLYIQV